ncbi:hypothetical protein GEMRC1_006987 [Eukaryota sp. GEM-RC1]
MSHSELLSNRSLDYCASTTDVVGFSSNISSQKSSSDTLTDSCSSFQSASIVLRVPQSLLVLIHLHYLNKFLTNTCKWNQQSHVDLKKELFTPFRNVGYVSNRFFESALLAVNLVIQTHMFPVELKDLPQLCLFAPFFGAKLHSVFLTVDRVFNLKEFLSYSRIISGLKVTLRNHNDLEFLNMSSVIFPRLKQLHVRVNRSISMTLIEMLKVNTTVTRKLYWR